MTVCYAKNENVWKRPLQDLFLKHSWSFRRVHYWLVLSSFPDPLLNCGHFSYTVNQKKIKVLCQVKIISASVYSYNPSCIASAKSFGNELHIKNYVALQQAMSEKNMQNSTFASSNRRSEKFLNAFSTVTSTWNLKWNSHNYNNSLTKNFIQAKFYTQQLTWISSYAVYI